MNAPAQTPGRRPAGERQRTVHRVSLVTLATNLILSGVKLVFGSFGQNQALFADGVHSLSDSVTDVAVLVGARYWNAPPDEDHPHGHGRIETLVTLSIGLVLAGVGVGLAYRALSTLYDPTPARHGALMLGAALFSLAANEGLYQWSVREGRRVRSSVLLANAWHHRSDGLSSLPVALSIVVRWAKPEWTWLDPVAALIVSGVVLKAAWDVAGSSVSRLIDASAEEEDCARLREIVLAHPEVRSMHALRTRHIGTGWQVDLHIQVDPEMSVREGHAIAHQLQDEILERGPDVVDVLTHVEPDDGPRGGSTGGTSPPPPLPSS